MCKRYSVIFLLSPRGNLKPNTKKSHILQTQKTSITTIILHRTFLIIILLKSIIRYDSNNQNCPAVLVKNGLFLSHTTVFACMKRLLQIFYLWRAAAGEPWLSTTLPPLKPRHGDLGLLRFLMALFLYSLWIIRLGGIVVGQKLWASVSASSHYPEYMDDYRWLLFI